MITRRSFLTLAATPSLLTLAGTDFAFAQLSNSDIQGVIVHDAFGNTVSERGIALVDWDGYIANPVVKLILTPPADITFPATLNLAATEPRMYFNSPSTIGASGPRKTVTFLNKDSSVPVYMSIFPDRNSLDKDYFLWFQLIDSNGNKRVSQINVRVFDQDSDLPSPFKITLDYTYDTAGFFNDSAKRAIVQQAADDWAYFIDDMQLDPVQAGTERVWIFPPITDFKLANLSPIPHDFTGFLMELYGVDGPQHRAGGEASDQGFQKSFGNELPLRRSGNVAFETQGNWNTLGWLTNVPNEQWYKCDNRGDHQNDLYSIARHEMGHVLFFNSNYPLFDKMKIQGALTSQAILDYHGHGPKIDAGDHFTGEIDDASLHPAFGNEYNGNLPEGRWLITKLDILAAEAVGYKVRKPFDLTIETDSMPGSFYGMHYRAQLKAKGGLPWYRWSIEVGRLPQGLTLDPDSGIISGIPMTPGSNTFVVSVRDSSEKQAIAVSKAINIPAI